MGGACSTYGDKIRLLWCFGSKHEGKRPLGRPRCRWEYIKMGLQEVGCGGMDWIELTKDRDN
jgi:hypothetical protein